MTASASTTLLPAPPPQLVPALKALKLGGMQDTLPLRLEQAQQQRLGYAESNGSRSGFALMQRAGTSLAWVSTLGPDRGKAQVTVDGQVVATVDLYSATQKTGQVVWSADGLAATGHTVRITVLGQPNAASTGNRVDIDAYLVLK